MTDKEKILELEKALASMKHQYQKLQQKTNALEQEVWRLEVERDELKEKKIKKKRDE